ncbi:methyl-accepting chemotaxis protein [Marinomonas sp. 2405UD68-3]|uniref:methyl-accepting chemotaxis protein n=1 Tax=Marinomonas sp. 2405UD68-3 TaxID=3391835 RepID=UPI0039C9A563
MSLSVIQRILSGFAILVLLIVVVASAGFLGLKQVEEKLDVVTGDVAEIVMTSNQVKDELMLSNLIMLRFLLSRDTDVLKSLEDEFTLQKEAFTKSTQYLSGLIKDRPSMLSELELIESEANNFYRISESAFINHKSMLENNAIILERKLDLKDSVLFAIEDLEILTESTDSEVMFAAIYMMTQMESLQMTINDYFDERDIDYLDVLYDSLGRMFADIYNQMKNVKDENIEILIKEIEMEVIPEEGVIMRFRNFLSMQETSVENAKQLSAVIDDISQNTNNLLLLADNVRYEARDDASGVAGFSRFLSLVIVLVSIVMAILVALWVSRSIKRPLGEVMTILGKIAQGDFTKRVTISSQDELGELSRWVNDLVDKLESVMRDIRTASTEVSESAKHSSLLANESKALMNSQNEQTTNVASAMTEMATTVQEVAKSSETTLNQVQLVDQKALDNLHQMDINVKAIETLVKEIESASKAVNVLDEHSQNIGKILEVIQSIAEQTNLLALNAAIEAARAGEQGRGFAVVADEVRTLATRTHSSTEEIQRVIIELQNGVKETVASMSKSCSSAYDSVSKSQKVGVSLQEMQTFVADIRDLTTQISTAAEQQSSVATEISKSVHHIAGMSEQASLAAVKTAQDSDSLEQLASHQQDLLKQFIIR